MNYASAIRIYALILLVILGGIVLHAPFSVALGTLFPDIELLVKSWKEILMVPAVFLAGWLVWRQNNWRKLAQDRILQLVVLYALLHLTTAAALLSGPMATVAGLMIDLRYVVFFALVYILLRLAPEYKKVFLQVAVAGAVIVIGFGVVQLFLPANILAYIGYGPDTIQPYLTVDRNYDYIRINSTLRGPNPLGAYVGIVLSLLAAAIMRGKLPIRRPKVAFMTALAALASLVVLWVAYSRSAVAAAGLSVFLVGTVAGRHLISRRIWIVGCVAVFALAGGLFFARDHSFVTNVILHENREGGSAVGSNEEHINSLQDGIERMLRQPVGAGIGSTGSASLMSEEPLIIENQYLFIAHEVGWLGLVLFVALFYLVLRRLWWQRRDWLSLGVLASGVGLSCIGLLLPVWADDTVAIVWWGLAAVAIAGRSGYARQQIE